MRKTNLFAFAATALILAGVGGWIASTAETSAAAPTQVGIDTSYLSMNAKDLPTERFQDFTFVFAD
jgi:hypothetical protein